MLIRELLKPYIKSLVFFTLFCLVFIFIRNQIVHDSHYNFLIWNLFLGFVPFLVAFVSKVLFKNGPKALLVICVGLWLLFYPNAPYMITDIIHVEPNESIVVYDALMIFSFAMLSLFFGFYSLKLIRELLSPRVNKRTINILIIGTLLLSSFGVYLGRILRLNSWDIFTKFGETMQMIFEHLFPFSKNPVTYLMILLFTIIQWSLLQLTIRFDSK